MAFLKMGFELGCKGGRDKRKGAGNGQGSRQSGKELQVREVVREGDEKHFLVEVRGSIEE